MLSCPVFVEMDPRQVFPSSNLCAVRLPHYPPKSFPLNLFADPHPLNRVASIFYKNVGGRGRHLRLSIPFHLSPMTYPLSFHILAHSFARFCTHQKLNSLVFNRLRTLCTKTGGGRGVNSNSIPLQDRPPCR